MTSLLQAIAEARPEGRGTLEEAASPAEPYQAPASEEAIKLALHLRETRATTGGRTLLFIPVSDPVDASLVVDDAVRGLLELQEGPVLVMDFRVRQARSLVEPEWPMESVDADGMSGAWGVAASSTAAVARPFVRRADMVRYAASPEFAGRLAEARSRYAYVLCIGGPVNESVQTLVTAPLFDGVILSVAPGKTTRSDMQRVASQLRRAHAKLIGFVTDSRTGPGGA